MRTLLLTALLSAAAAAPAAAQGHFVFTIDQGASAFTWSGTTSIGDINEMPPNFNLAGTAGVTMSGGGNPVASAGFPGTGAAHTVPAVIGGEIPNPLPLLPPLGTLSLTNLQAVITAAPFPVSAVGNFNTNAMLTFISGTLTVTPLGSSPTVTNLAGMDSDPFPVAGSLIWIGGSYVLTAPVSGVFPFNSGGVSGSLTLNGTIRANHVPVAPSVYCTSNPNSTGGTATVAFGGATSLALGNPTLDVSGLPSNTFGIVFYGANQTSAPFGNGVRCVGGAVQRLAPVNSGPLGAVSQVIDNSGLPASSPAVVGADLNFQFWYRDVPAGGAQFNTSDALTIRYTP